jgi:single-strand DNA-binding protein
MTDILTLTGLVATIPKQIVTGNGLAITTFRLASTQRRFDRTEQKWVDGDTNWYTISSFRQLATNVITSVQRGQRVVVTGRLRIRDWATAENHGTSVGVDADAIGHDLSWGTAQFTRSASTKVAEADAQAEADATTLQDAEVDVPVDPAAEQAADQADGEAEADDALTREREAVAADTPF